LTRLAPRARVYVINIDRFFSRVETGPGSQVLHDRDIERRYHEKRLWQEVHRRLCTKLAAVCGHTFAYFRAGKTGHWVVRGGSFKSTPVAEGVSTDQDQWNDYKASAERFVASLPVDRRCVLLIYVPHSRTKTAEAQFVADALGMELVAPQVEGLRTFDGSHLDKPSSELWSKAFFEMAGPRIRQCLQH